MVLHYMMVAVVIITVISSKRRAAVSFYKERTCLWTKRISVRLLLNLALNSACCQSTGMKWACMLLVVYPWVTGWIML